MSPRYASRVLVVWHDWSSGLECEGVPTGPGVLEATVTEMSALHAILRLPRRRMDVTPGPGPGPMPPVWGGGFRPAVSAWTAAGAGGWCWSLCGDHVAHRNCCWPCEVVRPPPRPCSLLHGVCPLAGSTPWHVLQGGPWLLGAVLSSAELLSTPGALPVGLRGSFPCSAMLTASLLAGASSDQPLGGRLRKLSLGQYDNDGGAQLSFSKHAWGKPGVDVASGLVPFSSPTDAKEVCVALSLSGPPPLPPGLLGCGVWCRCVGRRNAASEFRSVEWARKWTLKVGGGTAPSPTLAGLPGWKAQLIVGVPFLPSHPPAPGDVAPAFSPSQRRVRCAVGSIA